jgi:hypothetical protein
METHDEKISYSVNGNKFADIISAHREDLIHMMEIDFGLLDELLSKKVLTHSQYTNIKGLSDNMKVGQLLDDVMKMSPKLQSSFLAALLTCQQSHVVKYILGIKTIAEDWPLYKSTTAENIHRKLRQLKELIHWQCGLLDEMIAEKCITLRQKRYIEAGATKSDEEANDRLLCILLRQNMGTYVKFMKCIVKTKQHTVASLLAPVYVNKIQPITDTQSDRLERNWNELVELIDTKTGLIDEMFTADCLTSRQKEYIKVWRLTVGM